MKKGEKEEDDSKLETWSKEHKEFKKNGNNSRKVRDESKDDKKSDDKGKKDGKKEESGDMKEFNKAKKELKAE